MTHGNLTTPPWLDATDSQGNASRHIINTWVMRQQVGSWSMSAATRNRKTLLQKRTLKPQAQRHMAVANCQGQGAEALRVRKVVGIVEADFVQVQRPRGLERKRRLRKCRRSLRRVCASFLSERCVPAPGWRARASLCVMPAE
jgi:Tfp pilus assembly protein FimT